MSWHHQMMSLSTTVQLCVYDGVVMIAWNVLGNVTMSSSETARPRNDMMNDIMMKDNESLNSQQDIFFFLNTTVANCKSGNSVDLSFTISNFSSHSLNHHNLQIHGYLQMIIASR